MKRACLILFVYLFFFLSNLSFGTSNPVSHPLLNLNYPTQSNIGHEKPVVIYLAIDSPETYFQVTVDHEVKELKKLCLADVKAKAVFLISSQIGLQLTKSNLARIHYCLGGKLFSKQFQLRSSVPENQKGSPLVNNLVLSEVLELVTGDQMPFLGQAFFVQLKSHGYRDKVAIYLSEETLKARNKEQEKTIIKYGLKWPEGSAEDLGTGKYDLQFRALESILRGKDQVSKDYLGELKGLNVTNLEVRSAPSLSELDLLEILKNLTIGKNRLIPFVYLESCRSLRKNSDWLAKNLKKTFLYRAQGNLNYHNLNWGDFAGQIGDGNDLFYGVIVKLSELPNYFPDSELLLIVLKNDLKAFKLKIENGLGFESKIFFSKPLIWLLLYLHRYEMFNIFLEFDPKYIRDLYRDQRYDLFKEVLNGDFGDNPLPVEIIKRIYEIQESNYLRPVKRLDSYIEFQNQVGQILSQGFFDSSNSAVIESLEFIISELGIGPNTLFEVKPLQTVNSFKLNLTELCVFYNCSEQIVNNLVRAGIPIRETESMNWIRILGFQGDLLGYKLLIQKLGGRVSRANATELAGLLKFNLLSMDSILNAHAILVYLVKEFEADILEAPFGKNEKWTKSELIDYFQDLKLFFLKTNSFLNLNKKIVVKSLESKRRHAISNFKPAGVGTGNDDDDYEDDKWFKSEDARDLTIGTRFENLREAYSMQDIDVFSNFSCSTIDDQKNCISIFNAFATGLDWQEDSLRRNDRYSFFAAFRKMLLKKGFIRGDEEKFRPLFDLQEVEDVVFTLLKRPDSRSAIFDYFDQLDIVGVLDSDESEISNFGLWPAMGSISEYFYGYVFSGRNSEINNFLAKELTLHPEKFAELKVSMDFVIKFGEKLLSKDILFEKLTIMIQVTQMRSFTSRVDDQFPFKDIFVLYNRIGIELGYIKGLPFDFFEIMGSEVGRLKNLSSSDGEEALEFLLCKGKSQAKLGELIGGDYLDKELLVIKELLGSIGKKKVHEKVVKAAITEMDSLGDKLFACLFKDWRVLQFGYRGGKKVYLDKNFTPAKDTLVSTVEKYFEQRAEGISHLGEFSFWKPDDSLLALGTFRERVFREYILKAKLLIEFDPSIKNLRDSRGWTYLHWAAYLGNWGLVNALIESGVDPNVIDNSGLSVLDAFYIGRNLSYDVLLFLNEHGFNFKRSGDSERKSYYDLLASIPLKDIDNFSLVLRDSPRISPKFTNTKDFGSFSELSSPVLRYHYFYTMHYLRLNQ